MQLTDKALADFETKCDVRQEVLDDVREIRADGGRRAKVGAKSYVVERVSLHNNTLTCQTLLGHCKSGDWRND